MNRLENWPGLLHTAINAAMSQPFAWGVHDSLLMTSDIVQAITGEDIFREYRNRYSTGTGARRIARNKGGFDHLLDASLSDKGCPRIDILQVKRGDIVLFDNETLDCGVCIGETSLCISSEENTFFGVPTHIHHRKSILAITGWQIPF